MGHSYYLGALAVSVALFSSTASGHGGTRRQATAKFCETANVCLAQYIASPSNVVFRVGIPDDAAAPFDTLLHIVAPVSIGWAGLAWGGSMTNNPLTVAWPSGDDAALVSSRWASGHTLPGAYTGASYKTLSSSKNATHWAIEVLCQGCSQWGTSGKLNAAGTSTLAWAVGTGAVTQPTNNASSFGYHSGRGRFSLDLTTAKVASDAFQQYVDGTDSTAVPASPASSPASSVAATSATAPTVSSAATSTSTVVLSLPSPPPSSAAAPITITTTLTAKTATTPTTSAASPEDEDDDGDTVVTTVTTVTTLPSAAPRPPFFPGKGKAKGPPFRRPPFRGPPR